MVTRTKTMDKIKQAHDHLSQAVELITEWVKEEPGRTRTRSVVVALAEVRKIIGRLVPQEVEPKLFVPESEEVDQDDQE